MSKHTSIKLVLSFFVVAIVVGAFATTSLAKSGAGTPTTDCPLRACPSDLSGFTQTGTCTIDHGFPFIEVCTTWRNSSNDPCYKDTFCSWLG